jgi:uncharacterized protein
MKKSAKQISLEQKILELLSGKALECAEIIFNDVEIQETQEYANIVSIKRLGYNDHGPVHMRMAAHNSIKMFHLLKQADIKLSLQKEEIGSIEDSLVAVFVASILHDFGMTVARQNHEFIGVQLALPVINRILKQLYSNDFKKTTILRSLIVEGIIGHMATQKIHSLEAGLVLIGDGCDMSKGRARIPTLLSNSPKRGDIHRYSATAITKVDILKGLNKPILIKIDMSQSVGLFQIEEVLFPKIKSSPIKPYIELLAGVNDKDYLHYID